ncbi:GNAT family N-acetyltransferase [Desulfovibrio inopinatus]|uniref:GNAT family N-acetyltransferase n=1 Tax=Desulfovibrio inopinatus TaxID=102109 RepID=UPI00040F57DE|nr:GNAT family N-acetyltransferase [Desulfovibrio inopinatus]
MPIMAATADDYQEMIEVWEASVRATHDFLSEEDIQFFKPLIASDFFPAVDLYCTRDVAGTMQGFLGVAEGKIEMLFLAPRFQGKGLGRALIRFAIEVLDTTAVDVNEQNPSAVGFYKHMGFFVVCRSPLDGMGKPFPLLHMELRLRAK